MKTGPRLFLQFIKVLVILQTQARRAKIDALRPRIILIAITDRIIRDNLAPDFIVSQGDLLKRDCRVILGRLENLNQITVLEFDAAAIVTREEVPTVGYKVNVVVGGGEAEHALVGTSLGGGAGKVDVNVGVGGRRCPGQHHSEAT